jgi:hypothetical protein
MRRASLPVRQQPWQDGSVEVDMVKKYKSVLEKHNESLRPRRLPTPEEEAIEPVYPEEYLAGGPGKFAALGIKPSAGKTEDVCKQLKKGAAQRADPRLSKESNRYRIAQTRIGEFVVDIEADKAAKEAFAKTKQGKAAYESLRKKANEAAKTKAVNEIKEVTGRSLDRAQKNFFSEAGTHIGGAMADENRNAAGDTYKKGGEVKSRARRIDGCAIRGKTKGRMI